MQTHERQPERRLARAQQSNTFVTATQLSEQVKIRNFREKKYKKTEKGEAGPPATLFLVRFDLIKPSLTGSLRQNDAHENGSTVARHVVPLRNVGAKGVAGETGSGERKKREKDRGEREKPALNPLLFLFLQSYV